MSSTHLHHVQCNGEYTGKKEGLICLPPNFSASLNAVESQNINIMGEWFANEIVQRCGKMYETEVTKMCQIYSLFLIVYILKEVCMHAGCQ